MTEYIITGELVTELKSEIGTAIRDAIESGMTEYSEKLRELLAALDARPIIETPAPAKPELSQGWRVSISYETADGATPYVTDRDLVVGAVAELVGADLADNAITIEELDPMVEDMDSEYGAYLIPLTQAHVEQLAAGTTEFLVNHPMGGLIYITVEQA